MRVIIVETALVSTLHNGAFVLLKGASEQTQGNEVETPIAVTVVKDRALGKISGSFGELGIIERYQCLQRRVGTLTTNGTTLTGRSVEDLHRRRRRTALPKR